MKPEIVANIIAGIACAIALGSFIYAFFANKKANNLQAIANQHSSVQALTAQGQLEISIRDMINNARDRMEQKTIEQAELFAKKTATEEMKRVKTDALLSAQENFLNCYNEACAKYRDGKVDMERFKRLYENDIRTITEKDDIYNDKSKQNSYQCIRAVAREWFIHEK